MIKDAPKLSPFEKDLIYELSGDLGDSLTPYADLAAKIGVDEELILKTIEKFNRLGLMRRLGVTLRHQKSGFKANAMVVWRLKEEQISWAGQTLAALPYVSHCYQRQIIADWPYSLYTMIHAQKSEEIDAYVREMSLALGNPEHKILTSLAELKKTSMRYFA